MGQGTKERADRLRKGKRSCGVERPTRQRSSIPENIHSANMSSQQVPQFAKLCIVQGSFRNDYHQEPAAEHANRISLDPSSNRGPLRLPAPYAGNRSVDAALVQTHLDGA